MELIYRKWDEVPIKIYKEITQIVDGDGDETSKSVALIATLCGVPEEEIWNLSLPEVGSLSRQASWVWDFDFDKDKKPHKLRVAGEEYVVNYDVTKMSIAAYVDFQNYFKDKDRFMGALLTTFVLPKGHKYADDYDVAALAQKFEAEIPITTFNTLLYFFVLTSLNSIRGMQIYSDLMIKKLMKSKSLTKEEREKIAEIMEKKRQAEGTFGFPL